MQNVVRKIYEDLLKVQKQESILIIFDKKTKGIADEFFEHGSLYGCNILCIEIPEGKQHGEEPGKEIARMFMKYDILLLITTKSLSHTNARRNASAAGKRIITMPGITKEILMRCVDIDYSKPAKFHFKLYELMKQSKNFRIKTKLGTDLRFKIYNKKVDFAISLSKPGDFHNIPIGEVYVAVKEESCNGIYVVDASHSGIGKLKKPLKIVVKNGLATSFEGNHAAKKLYFTLKKIGRKAFNIAEFGIGTNPKAKITGNILEDEKVKGTCHIALGNNYSFGGKVNVPIHLDGIITKPTIYFDKKRIMKNGKLEIGAIDA